MKRLILGALLLTGLTMNAFGSNEGETTVQYKANLYKSVKITHSNDFEGFYYTNGKGSGIQTQTVDFTLEGGDGTVEIKYQTMIEIADGESNKVPYLLSIEEKTTGEHTVPITDGEGQFTMEGQIVQEFPEGTDGIYTGVVAITALYK
ncbi:hypothetical protein PM10SUCC1_09100 [Propionigenium maris DSM 9537]|uniref:Uncharacterized protein n=1 Tax=Propionigenium maris DSM 9537 TaxID=1123000 RepID=A0A9W6LLK3_9FUSO|nr:hypothetical protein [Propionigenium maris]GLI55396.1 hypothetical protein PM10SUCC1_09100 [Propionigenium maris DSM 9537]